MGVYEVLRRLVAAAGGRVLNDAEQAELHDAINTADPDVESPEQAAKSQEAAAKAEADERAEYEAFQAWKATQARPAAAQQAAQDGPLSHASPAGQDG